MEQHGNADASVDDDVEIRHELEQELREQNDDSILSYPLLNFTLKLLREAERTKNIDKQELERRLDEYMRGPEGKPAQREIARKLNTSVAEVFYGMTPLEFDADEYLRSVQRSDMLYVEEEQASDDDEESDTDDNTGQQHILDVFSLSFFNEPLIDPGPAPALAAPTKCDTSVEELMKIVDLHWEMENNWHKFHWKKDDLQRERQQRFEAVQQVRERRIRRNLGVLPRGGATM